MELVKWIIVLLIGGGVTAAVALLSSRGDHFKRLFVVAMIWSSLAFPIVTIDFQFGERHNVRGWEFGWPDFIALGLICGHIMRGRPLKQLVGPLSVLWMIHFIILEISALQGIDPLFSHYAIVRQLRTFLVLTAATACIRSWRDGEAVIAGLAIVCLVNEWRVLQQKYLYGRFQCVGSFDHQNAMAMFLTMAAHPRCRLNAESRSPTTHATAYRCRRCRGSRCHQLIESGRYVDLGGGINRLRHWQFSRRH